jgi:hypothetical protein
VEPGRVGHLTGDHGGFALCSHPNPGLRCE